MFEALCLLLLARAVLLLLLLMVDSSNGPRNVQAPVDSVMKEVYSGETIIN
jgi:hypothetical protein